MADSTSAAAASADRPVKPDEATYKDNLDKAEKEHKEVMNRFVGRFCFLNNPGGL